MKLTNIRHVSQSLFTAVDYNPAANIAKYESCTIKSVSLNKNKIYKIKNLNILNENIYGNTNVDINLRLIFSNDQDFINTIYLGWLANLNNLSITSINYYDSAGTSTNYPFLATKTDVDSIPSRSTNQLGFQRYRSMMVFNTLDPTYTGRGSNDDSLQRLLYFFPVVQNLLRLIPLNFRILNGATTSILYSNVYEDFSFYNNLSNSLYMMPYISYYNYDPLNPLVNSTGTQYTGSIDFDIEEYEAED